MSPGCRGTFQSTASGSSVFEGRVRGRGGGFLNFFPLDMIPSLNSLLPYIYIRGLRLRLLMFEMVSKSFYHTIMIQK